ncbi:hypothetical protein FBY31_2241 [Arthrobacter sp. SLBN-100]|nr:hypothetical protein FBY31_2241 [Arthrobacter sp. SLBN-100]
MGSATGVIAGADEKLRDDFSSDTLELNEVERE